MLSTDATKVVMNAINGRAEVTEDEVQRIILKEAEYNCSYHRIPFDRCVHIALGNILRWFRYYNQYRINPQKLSTIREALISLRETTVWAVLVGHEINKGKGKITRKEWLSAGCDGSGPHAGNEIKKLPLSAGGNLLLCSLCFTKEMVWRRGMNEELPEGQKFDIMNWKDLEVVDTFKGV